jgi:hypothetical protein
MASKPLRRVRKRRDTFKIDRDQIGKRISDFYTIDGTERDIDLQVRLQRYAKYRMWTAGDDGPWENSSDVAISDMMEKSLRMQDTLNNAVLAQRPAIVSQAVLPTNSEKEGHINSLLDYQFFEEANGEKFLGDVADVFVNDGVFTAFIPWVKEVRRQSDVRVLEKIPEDMFPSDYFESIIRTMFRDEVTIIPKQQEQPWDFTIERTKPDESISRIDMSFYTREDGAVEVVLTGDVTVYEAPLPRVVPYDDVFHPARCENLQPPGPHNPRGAAHVIIRDYPGKDEITRLKRSGFYNLLTDEELESLSGYARDASAGEEEAQKDALSGKSESTSASDPEARSHETLTRLTVFDRYDIDGDGLDEDVIWWYLEEPGLVVKAKVLQEMYPSLRPDHPRPFAEASLFPIVGRRTGISLLEMLEGLHDMIKILFDQSLDSNTISIVPFGFYRPTSSMQSERIRLSPGELYPLSDPQRDINFPQVGNPQAQGFALNLISLLSQMSERVSVIGDFQLGRVPAGRSTALRTVGGMQALQGQGEARPERILRRFFKGLADIFAVMHDLNQYFLPKKKQIRLQGILKPGQNPYLEINDRTELQGAYQFKFTANAFNTTKQQLQETMAMITAKFINAMTVQLGIVRPENIYNMLRDEALAYGVNPAEKGYLSEPIQGFGKRAIFAEEAMLMILDGQMPDGRPAEPGGWAEHAQKLEEIEAQLTDPKVDTGEISPETAQMFQQYRMQVAEQMQVEAQQQAMMQNAQAFAQAQGGGQGGQGGRPAENAPPDPNQNPQLSGPTEMLDETLPTAGGGAPR